MTIFFFAPDADVCAVSDVFPARPAVRETGAPEPALR